MAKVDTEKVDVATESPEALDFEAATSASLAASTAAADDQFAPSPAGPADGSEPPLPSWMSSTKAEEVHLEEREVHRPPSVPEEWQSSSDDGSVQTYAYRKPTDGQGQSYKGAGGPKR